MQNTPAACRPATQAAARSQQHIPQRHHLKPLKTISPSDQTVEIVV